MDTVRVNALPLHPLPPPQKGLKNNTDGRTRPSISADQFFFPCSHRGLSMPILDRPLPIFTIVQACFKWAADTLEAYKPPRLCFQFGLPRVKAPVAMSRWKGLPVSGTGLPTVMGFHLLGASPKGDCRGPVGVPSGANGIITVILIGNKPKERASSGTVSLGR